MPAKPRLAMYWAAGCGGCEVSLVNLHEFILTVAEHFDFMFCPCLLDTKKSDLEALPDGAIAITLVNGALRSTENVEMVELLRKKSQLIIAYGACAASGGIPALANLAPLEATFATVYDTSPSTVNPAGVRPVPLSRVPEGELEIPALLDKVLPIASAVAVDYYIPGCPPEPHMVQALLTAIVGGATLPARGSVIGAGELTVCDECQRKKGDKKLAGLIRTYAAQADPESCLLEQGFPCLGVATRSGCSALCPQANLPCSGCYGAPPGVTDPGARFIAALGSCIPAAELAGLDEAAVLERLKAFAATMPDVAGTCYKYTLGNLFAGRSVKHGQ